ncbi:stage V sporulation protein AA [Tissierella sp.]|uniref:stage V sporulation protein AA n=1 Tax=Tissierella sp. TaxID=41274 RepID=UPI0028586F37|nr:stage V sporulation protein AA [Tissierella sp.]MDR7857147.1 stage V sporulation protein AA [Tissierella sp.]
MDKDKVYISVKKKASIDIESDVLVKDLGEVFCTRAELQLAISNIVIKNRNGEEDWDNITAIQIAEKVLGKYSNVDLDMLGEPEILLEYKSQETKKTFLEFVKITLICIVLFFGAGLAITNFHEDVNTKASMEKLYFTLTGEKEENPLIMNIPYSIGIGVGVIVFFNRMISSSKRRKMEPGPMEIELYLYDQSMETQISNEVKKNKEL